MARKTDPTERKMQTAQMRAVVLSPQRPSRESVSCSVATDSATPPTAARLHCPWNSPGKSTEVGSLFTFQGIFPTHGSNPGLLH